MRTSCSVRYAGHKRTRSVGLDEVPRVVRFIETERRMVAARGWGGDGSQCVLGTGFEVCKMKRVLWMDGGDGFTTMSCTLEKGKNVQFLCIFHHNKKIASKTKLFWPLRYWHVGTGASAMWCQGRLCTRAERRAQLPVPSCLTEVTWAQSPVHV